MKKRYIIFDFDGTIANTVDPALSLANGVLKGMDEKPLTRAQLSSLRDKSYLEIIQTFNVALWKVPGLLLKLRTTLLENFDKITPYAGIIDILNQLSKEGYYLYILTSNDKSFVQRFLKTFKITVIEDVFSEMNIFGKADALKKFMRIQKITTDNMVYIGDEVRDIEACKKNKATVISVSWGFNTADKLAEYEPNAIANTPAELHTAITKLTK